MQKIALINEFDTRQEFELRPDEATNLIHADAIFFCLADSLKLAEKQGIDNLYAFHVNVAPSTAEVWAEGVNAILDARRANGENGVPENVATSDQSVENQKAEADFLAGILGVGQGLKDKFDKGIFSIVAPPDKSQGGSTLN